MVEQITFQTIFQFLQTVSIMVGIAYYIMILQNQQKNMNTSLETRQAQLFMDIYQTYVTKEIHRDIEIVLKSDFIDFEDWLSKYGPQSNPDGHAKFDSVLSYMEGMGCLVKRGLIDPSYVVELLGLEVLYLHQKYQPVISGLRRANPTVYTDFDVLYESVKRYIPEPSLAERHSVQ